MAQADCAWVFLFAKGYQPYWKIWDLVIYQLPAQKIPDQLLVPAPFTWGLQFAPHAWFGRFGGCCCQPTAHAVSLCPKVGLFATACDVVRTVSHIQRLHFYPLIQYTWQCYVFYLFLVEGASSSAHALPPRVSDESSGEKTDGDQANKGRGSKKGVMKKPASRAVKGHDDDTTDHEHQPLGGKKPWWWWSRWWPVWKWFRYPPGFETEGWYQASRCCQVN